MTNKQRVQIRLSKKDLEFLETEFGTRSEGIRLCINFTREERLNWKTIKFQIQKALAEAKS